MSDQPNLALVTGGASGMGKITALRLAESGSKVVIVDLNQEKLDEIASQFANVFAHQCDMGDVDAVRNLVADIKAEHGKIDRLVHCAGIMPAYHLRDESPENIERVMRVNFLGTVNIVQTVLPDMLARNSGDIIAFGSMVGMVPANRQGAYCASKAAVNMYMEVLATELRDTNLRILLVCPPAAQTPLMNNAIETQGSAGLRSMYEQGKMTDPELIVDAVDKAIVNSKSQVWPLSARWYHWARRLCPNLLWSLVLRVNK